MSSIYMFERENLDLSEQAAFNVSLSTTIGLGLGKEIVDLYSRHGVASYKDLVADIIGMGIAYFLFVRD